MMNNSMFYIVTFTLDRFYIWGLCWTLWICGRNKEI